MFLVIVVIVVSQFSLPLEDGFFASEETRVSKEKKHRELEELAAILLPAMSGTQLHVNLSKAIRRGFRTQFE